MCEKKDARRQTLDAKPLHARLALKRDEAISCGSGVWRLASLALIAVACSANPPVTATTTIIATSVPTTTSAQTPWIWGIDSVDLGGGYALGPCEGDANQIACFTSDGGVIGSAELLTLSVTGFDLLDGVDDPIESVELIAADYIATFLADRQSVCPSLEFRELAPVTVDVGGAPGLRYGFEEQDGAVTVEKNVIYGVRMEDTVKFYSFSAIAEGACLSNEGELTDPSLLDGLQARLDQVMATVESG